MFGNQTRRVGQGGVVRRALTRSALVLGGIAAGVLLSSGTASAQAEPVAAAFEPVLQIVHTVEDVATPVVEQVTAPVVEAGKAVEGTVHGVVRHVFGVVTGRELERPRQSAPLVSGLAGLVGLGAPTAEGSARSFPAVSGDSLVGDGSTDENAPVDTSQIPASALKRTPVGVQQPAATSSAANAAQSGPRPADPVRLPGSPLPKLAIIAPSSTSASSDEDARADQLPSHAVGFDAPGVRVVSELSISADALARMAGDDHRQPGTTPD
ncbi:hypothetical protein NLX83_10150 [Allokutzneria sp. A3M-2-11 16]|uniref:hypothetical protein n=1 Tax=Allokutzneria sp. A3M-2-11 16 TaxID=2962043 RepID=UPI0020B73A0D|nr:hypothetical protein [Allokutzneria sp. A3M-2-11 16]MCP3799617.1 hypothetical protein [Allokutzneria sp. A3M-2-11 16]